MPSTPTVGAHISFADGYDWSINSLIVGRNGNTIEGISEDMTLNVKGIQVEFIYSGTTWEVYAYTGPVGVDIEDNTTLNDIVYPIWSTFTSGYNNTKVTSTRLYFNPSTGVLNSTDYNSLSDRNFKKDIESINDALSIVENIDPIKFRWISNDTESFGVIAQDIEEVLPQVVKTNNGIKSVSYSQLVPILIQAVKELKLEIVKMQESK